jgi:hypothetical protein
MDRESGGSHGSKTLGEFLFHGIDSGIDADQRHNAKGDNGDGNTGPEFIAPDRPERKRKDITYSHNDWECRSKFRDSLAT